MLLIAGLEPGMTDLGEAEGFLIHVKVERSGLPVV
jgi:hypothetical protein